MAKKTLSEIITAKPLATDTYDAQAKWWAEVQAFAQDNTEADLPNKNSVIRDCITALSQNTSTGAVADFNIDTNRIVAELEGAKTYLGIT